VKVESQGLAGLLGLAVDATGRTFAAYTSAKNRLVVEQVAPGKRRLVYDAGRAGNEANGGRLAFRADGKLLLTVGDRDRSVKAAPGGDVTFPDFPNWSGYIAVLDPATKNASPQKLATGWFNPYGLAVTPSGAVWATDNAVDGPEHLARADEGPKPTHVANLPHMAPAGLAALDDTRLAVCGYVSRRLDLYTVGANGIPGRTTTLAKDCTVGVTRLADGRLAYANEREIRVATAPPT
jgi:hypothetical protein